MKDRMPAHALDQLYKSIQMIPNPNPRSVVVFHTLRLPA